MTLVKLLDLIARRSLFFASVKHLRDQDPFEGHITTRTRRFLLEAGATEESARKVLKDAGWSEEELARPGPELFFRLMLESDERDMPGGDIYVSCWHESAHESAALWKLYAEHQEGIAIISSFGSVCDAVDTDAHVHGGRVAYHDYNEHFSSFGNAFYPVMSKRNSFEHEKEVRFALLQFGTDPIRGLELADGGVRISCDIDKLISEIVVSPYAPSWSLRSISAAIAALGCQKPVRQSTLLRRI